MAKRCRFFMGGQDLARGRLCGQPAQRVLVYLAGPVGRPGVPPHPDRPDVKVQAAVTLCKTHEAIL